MAGIKSLPSKAKITYGSAAKMNTSKATWRRLETPMASKLGDFRGKLPRRKILTGGNP